MSLDDQLNNIEEKIPETTDNVDSESEKPESFFAIMAAIAGNVAVGIIKFIAAVISGSAAMFSEGIHSVVDCMNEILVLIGLKQAKKKPNLLHPFGYGKELYFWTLLVALMIFFTGGGVSIFDGIQSIVDSYNGEKELISPLINYIVLVLSMAIEGTSFYVAIKSFNKSRKDIPPIKYIREVKDPSLFTIVLEDAAAEAGLAVALIGNILCDVTKIPYFDGIASIVIGLILCFVAVILLVETKGLLIGEGIDKRTIKQIRQIVESNEGVKRCGRVLSMYFGPKELLIAIDATFDKTKPTEFTLAAIDNIEKNIHQCVPEATRIFIEVESFNKVLNQLKYIKPIEDAAKD